MQAPPQLLIFDWDGTLMDSERQIVSSLLAASRDLGLRLPEVDACRNIIGLGLREAILALYPEGDEALVADYIARYRHHWFGCAHECGLFPEVEETLQYLVRTGYRLAVATGKGRRGLDKALAETGLAGLFEATRTAEETRSKPHPQMLQELLDELDVAAEAALMIGDTEYDLAMARSAGVASIAVTYGAHSVRRLRDYQPLTCLDRISELRGWLGAIESNRTTEFTTLSEG